MDLKSLEIICLRYDGKQMHTPDELLCIKGDFYKLFVVLLLFITVKGISKEMKGNIEVRVGKYVVRMVASA